MVVGNHSICEVILSFSNQAVCLYHITNSKLFGFTVFESIVFTTKMVLFLHSIHALIGWCYLLPDLFEG